MCGKMGNTEIESLENMMSMAVYFVIADALEIDAEELFPNSDLQHDLGMTAATRVRLDQAIMDMFNNLHVDFNRISTVQDVVNQVAKVTIH